MNQRKAGVILSYFNTGLNSIIMLLYVPMLLHYLTKAQYGVYQLMGSLIAMLSLMDFGLGNSVTRFLSQAKARKDAEGEKDVLSTARFLYLLICIVILLVGGVLYFFITPLYQHTLSAQELLLAKQIFVLLLVNFVICISGNIFISVLFAYERFIPWQLICLINTITMPLMAWAVLSWKADALYLVIIQTLCNMFYVGLNYWYCRFKLAVRFPISFQHKELLKRLATFSLFVFIGNVSGQVYWRLGSFVLGAIVGAVAVANYYIGTQICLFFLIFSGSIGGIFFPKLSADWVINYSLATHNDIFCKTGRLQAMIAFLVLTGFAFLGKQFLFLWLGPGNEICYWVALIFMVGYSLSIIQNVAGSILQAIDKYAFYAWASLAISAVNIVVAIILTRVYGLIGCAVSTALCLLVGLGIVLNIYYSKIGLDVKRFFQQLTSVFIGALGAGVCLWFIFSKWPVENTWISFIVHGCSIVAIYTGIMIGFVFNAFEKSLLIEGINYTKRFLCFLRREQ